MRKFYLCILGAALALALGTFIVFTGQSVADTSDVEATRASSTEQFPPAVETDKPQGEPSGMEDVPGVPAITAHSDTVRRFTQEDVIAYIRDHPHRNQDPSKGPPVVKNVEFVSVGELAKRMQIDFNRPHDAVLAVATLEGNFFVPGRVGSNGYSVHTSRLVFDGTTGNLLLITVEE